MYDVYLSHLLVLETDWSIESDENWITSTTYECNMMQNQVEIFFNAVNHKANFLALKVLARWLCYEELGSLFENSKVMSCVVPRAQKESK